MSRGWANGGTNGDGRHSARPLADLLDRVLSGLGIGLPSRMLGRLMEDWPSLVGAELAEVSEPVAVRGDVIVVHVDNPAAAEMLSWKAEEILGRLRREAGSEGPRSISVKVRRTARRSPRADP
ncbi:MAG: hypothetical protein KatS3mg008_1408 [Acidimicrobiales bacterium]|nr:MAG: hypothetical protein KatS3mg008_1408 [Acidimicrobiales bacterium]